MEYVEVEELEEEDPDVHFKRKRQGGSHRKRVVKKPRRYGPTVIVEGKSSAVPPLDPLIIKLSAPRQTAGIAILDLSKISSVLAIHSHIFHTAHCLLHDSGTEAVETES